MEGLSSIHRRGAAPSPARGEKRGRDGSDLNNIIVKLHVMCIIYTWYIYIHVYIHNLDIHPIWWKMYYLDLFGTFFHDVHSSSDVQLGSSWSSCIISLYVFVYSMQNYCELSKIQIFWWSSDRVWISSHNSFCFQW